MHFPSLCVNQRRYRTQKEFGYSVCYGADQRRDPPLIYIHTFQPMPDRKLAAWYGPPPPFPAREPINWGPLPTKEIKALIAGPLPLRGIHR